MEEAAERYCCNFELWACRCPFEAQLFAASSVAHSSNSSRRIVQDSMAEALQWKESLPLADVKGEKNRALFVFGLGHGSYFFPLKSWLSSRNHHLVFIEDDASVIEAFLHAEVAREILKHPRVSVQFWPSLDPDPLVPRDLFWQKIRIYAKELIWTYANASWHVSALQSYFLHRFPVIHEAILQWYVIMGQARRRLHEFLPKNHLVFANLYANLPLLAKAVPFERMAKGFESLSLPAIISGAGPSITKQLPLLAKLKDKALILAAGSALSVLTRSGIAPHAAGAIDPTDEQVSRLMNSFAIDVPVFYRQRFNAKALAMWPGTLLFVGDNTTSFQVGRWFEERLGLSSSMEVIGGVSASNFLIEIAALLGFKALVLSGVDLCYGAEGQERYAEGVVADPADAPRIKEGIRAKSSNLIEVPGNGGMVSTKHDWFLEALCFTAFKERNADVALLNASPQGMAIAGVPYVSLEEAMKAYEGPSIDVEGWLHGIIEEGSCSVVGEDEIFLAMEEWKGSLRRCQGYLEALKAACADNQRKAKLGQSVPYGPYSGTCALFDEELKGEIAYVQFLQTVSRLFDVANAVEGRRLSHLPKESKRRCLGEIAFELCRISYLLKEVKRHLREIDRSLKKARRKMVKTRTGRRGNAATSLHPIPKEYRQGAFLVIDEPDLRVKICSPFVNERINEGWRQGVFALCGYKNDKREGQSLYFYEDGTKRAEAFYHEGRLQGPSCCYGRNGGLLVCSWFVADRREGYSCFFYGSGNLHSIKGYCEGLSHGEHRYFHRNGGLKAIVPYRRGLLHGKVLRYDEEGRLAMERTFDQGKVLSPSVSL